MKITTGILTITSACLILVACSHTTPPQQRRSSSPYTVRWTDQAGYNTNVLSVAQAETPFTIVLPSYLPVEIHPTPHFAGRDRSEFDDSRPVTITYKRQRNDDDLIYIEEYHMTSESISSNESVILTYLDTQITEEENTAISFTGDGKQKYVDSHSYNWNRKNINFDVSITELKVDESRKIVESMIK